MCQVLSGQSDCRLLRGMDMHYVMGSNIAGHLPDGEPWGFATYEEATAAMAEDMEQFADEWGEDVDYREEDYRTAAAACRDGSVSDQFGPLIGFEVMPSTDGRVWWVTPCDPSSEDCMHDGDA